LDNLKQRILVMNDTTSTLLALAARRAFTILGAWLATKGLINGDTSGFVGACMIIAEVGYEGWNRYGMVLVNGQLAKMKGVHPGQPTAVVPPAAKALIIFAVLFSGFNIHKANAQSTFATAKPAATATKAATPATTPASSLPTLQQILANPALLVQQLQGQFVTDVTNALADAKGQTPPDQDSISCYTFLLNLANSPLANPIPSTPGIITAIQKGRDAATEAADLTSPNGPLSGLNSACAAWNNDNKTTLAQIAAKLGMVAGAAGMKLSLGGLALGGL
jgi:hypothetical protein